MNRKTLQIEDRLHHELKVYAAKKGEGIRSIVSAAIIKALKEGGHKFTNGKIKK